ncbi:MAG: anion permease [Candidatus Aenigmarchaeota archaeon]|nr:anion permease [Candidatus Aenigmarchaeota archaeon]
MSIIPIIILAVVFVFIAVRQIGNMRLQIWHIMLAGAVAVLLTMQIAPIDALKAVNIDVMIFLFGMFVLGRALVESGYLSHVSRKLFKSAKSTDHLVLIILFGIGFASAILMNDTLAIIGTPAILLLAKEQNISPRLLMFALAFSITIGGVMSPIGNPQNFLISTTGHASFIDFLKYLFIPTTINLLITYFVLKFFFKKEFGRKLSHAFEEKIEDPELSRISRYSLFLLVGLICTKIIITIFLPIFDFSMTYIAIIVALPILLFSKKRISVLKTIDWSILVFFASMFVLMAAVWQSGFFQEILAAANLQITSIAVILIIAVLLSQAISNVPLVALYLPMLLHAGAGTRELMALAAGSTIAGNFLILGAASNVIIIQNAEKQGQTLALKEFAKIGIPLTIINIAVYWIFLTFL